MGQDYDKIIKENIESIILPLARKVLGIPEPEGLVEIPDDVQYTIERKPDFLKLVTNEAGIGQHILHLEFQTRDEPDMLSRMLFYAAQLYGKYKLPVKQYVLFVGGRSARMRRELIQDDLTFRFQVRNVIDVSYSTFLDTDNPEEAVIAILGNLGSDTLEIAVGRILQTLKRTAKDTLALGRFIRQLEVLSKLRDAQDEVIKQIERMPIIYDLETDIRYLQGKQKGSEESMLKGMIKGMQEGRQEGLQEGRQEAMRDAVKGLLSLGGLNIDQIAKALNVTTDFVLAIQSQLPDSTK